MTQSTIATLAALPYDIAEVTTTLATLSRSLTVASQCLPECKATVNALRKARRIIQAAFTEVEPAVSDAVANASRTTLVAR